MSAPEIRAAGRFTIIESSDLAEALRAVPSHRVVVSVVGGTRSRYDTLGGIFQEPFYEVITDSRS